MNRFGGSGALGPEELRAVIVARLERVGEQDLTAVLEPGALAESRQLAGMIGTDDTASRYALGWLHWCRYCALPDGEDEADYEAAIDLLTQCFIAGAGTLPESAMPVLAGRAVQAAHALVSDASASPDEGLAAAAVDLWRRIIAATPAGDRGLASRRSALGAALLISYQRTGAPADLDASVQEQQAALEATPDDDPGRPRRLLHLGAALQARFDRSEDPADLDAALRAHQAAVDATPPGARYRAAHLSHLGAAFQTHFHWSRRLDELDTAVRLQQEAIESAHEGDIGLPKYLSNLAVALHTRFAHTGDIASVQAAVKAQQAAIDTTPLDHPDRPTMLSNLGAIGKKLFERTGDLDDLNQAIKASESAVATSPQGHPDRAGRLSNLGDALRDRFEQTSELADIDAAIEAHRAAVDASPADHADHAGCSSNLGAALMTRFAHTRAMTDLDAAIKTTRAAVGAIPDDHPDRNRYLSNLGTQLLSRFVRFGDLADLDASINAARAAVDLTPVDHPARAVYECNLALSLGTRGSETESRADLDAAIQAGQAALNVTPPDHPEYARRQSALGGALLIRFVQTRSLADLTSAVEKFQVAVASTAGGDPLLAGRLSRLGDSLGLLYALTHVAKDRKAATSAHVRVAGMELAAPSKRIHSAWAAARQLAESSPRRAADLLERAVEWLPQVAPRQLARTDQQHAISDFAGLASDAAALTLTGPTSKTLWTTGRKTPGRAARALSLLETGRAVLLSQALSTRDDLTDLRRQDPDLAGRFTRLRERIDEPDDVAFTSGARADQEAVTVPGLAAEERRRLAGQLAQTLAEIRALDGLSSFGLPVTTRELTDQAAAGPVVAFNVSGYRSDALLLTTSGVASLPLPELTRDTLESNIRSFHEAISETAGPSSSQAGRAAAQRTMTSVLGWLWDVAAGPVLDALGLDKPPAPGSPWPRVWWAPGGLLGLLPIHAAGHHADQAAGIARRTVLDRVISSYTPTVRALRYARQQAPDPGRRARMLVVGMPVTPGQPRDAQLPGVHAEVDNIAGLLPRPVILSGPATGRNARRPTATNVLRYLPDCSIAHFACHSSSDPTDPSRSRLILRDHDASPLTVTRLASLRHDHLQLVYLSACRTTYTPDTELLDEAIHLTSAFQLSGSRHVIGTLWEIPDATAAAVAAAFYGRLRTGPAGLDTDRAAPALHHAMLALRGRRPQTPFLWAAYMHAGA